MCEVLDESVCSDMVLDSPFTVTSWYGARSPLHGDQDLDSDQSNLSTD